MIATTHTFALGDLRMDGSVLLTPAGFDIVRAVLLRGISTAAKGEDKAREMKRLGGGDLVAASITYYRNAGAFLRHMLKTMTSHKIEMRNELYALRGVSADQPYPPEWEEYLQLAADLELPDEPGKPAGEGRGAGDRGEFGATPAKAARRRPGRKGKAD